MNKLECNVVVVKKLKRNPRVIIGSVVTVDSADLDAYEADVSALEREHERVIALLRQEHKLLLCRTGCEVCAYLAEREKGNG